MESSLSNRDSPRLSSNNSSKNLNKEDVVAFENKFEDKFDRIKERSRNGTKKVPPSISKSAGPISRPPPPSLLKQHLRKQQTTANMAAASLSQLPRLDTQVASRALTEGYFTETPPYVSRRALRAYDSKDDYESYTPIRPVTKSDPIYQGVFPQGATRQNVDSPASAATAATSATFASNGSSLKRKADPECDEEPSPKRSRAGTVEQQDEGYELATTRSHTAFDSGRAPPQVNLPGTYLLDNLSRKVQESSDSLLSSEESRETSITPADSEDRTDKDAAFVEKVKGTLQKQSTRKTNNVGRRQARRILELLKLATPAADDSEAVFLTGEEAKTYLQTDVFFPGPIFTTDQQPLPLQTIPDFLSEYYDDSAQIWIQDPDHKLPSQSPATRAINMGKLKEQFDKGRVPTPYNCLELATHVEDGIRPAFLITEDCRLLTKLKHPSAADKVSRRGYEPGWKEVEKWALLAKAGALTEPHQDSHGYSTYFTVNQGTIGFGWLSNPTPAQRKAWRADPATFTAGEWRYAVLRPGQTVYFPSGTVHFVFRHPSEGDTLAFGGHVLRCSQIVNWVKCLLEEKESNSDVTNEDLSVSAPAYLERVERFVRQAREKGVGVGKWGGEEGIEEFLELKKVFMEWYGVGEAEDEIVSGKADGAVDGGSKPVNGGGAKTVGAGTSDLVDDDSDSESDYDYDIPASKTVAGAGLKRKGGANARRAVEVPPKKRAPPQGFRDEMRW